MRDQYGNYPARNTNRARPQQNETPGNRSSSRRTASEVRREYENRNAGSRSRFLNVDDADTPTRTRAASRPAYSASRASSRSASRSGSIPPQTRTPRYNAAASATARPQRNNNQAYGRGNEYVDAAQTPYRDHNRYLSISKKPERKGRRIVGVLVSLAAVAAVVLGGFLFVQSLPANITLNGASFEVHGDKTLADALAVSGIKPQAGDLLAIDGSVLEVGKGEPFHATINGKETSDLTTKLASGDAVEISNGGPLEEPSQTLDQIIPWTVTEEGRGAIHLVEGQGTDGAKTSKVGQISGITIDEVTQEPSNIVRRNVSPNVGGDKVVALTFDDGPWGDQTTQVLDVLAKHKAKATFFTLGNRIEQGDGAALVQRAAAEGHQICTHSYDHASGSGQGVNLGYMTPEEQLAEIEKGYAAIEVATGNKASRIIRTPGGNFGAEVAKTLEPVIDAEIGWNVDSSDWEKPGASAIASAIEDVWPGAIVLMHDGGGDRAQTIEALKKALPVLKERGYRFITIDELMEYPLS